MEAIEENIQNVEIKIAKLNNFIALSLRRNKISKELEQLISEIIKVRDILTEAHEQMQKEFNSLEYDYEDVMSQMRKKQMQVMDYLIKEKQKKIKASEEEQKKVDMVLSCSKAPLKAGSARKNYGTAPQPAVKLLGANLAELKLNQGMSFTPKIKITEYKNSPLVKRKINPVPFQFVEFDVTVTQKQFETIPKYMCGRETLAQLNSFLETVIIPCFNEKYQLIHKERNCLSNLNDIELWKLYNEQASSLPGRHFITCGDITRKLNKMLDKKSQNRLVMLRHIGILQEMRIKQTVFYVWSCNQVQFLSNK